MNAVYVIVLWLAVLAACSSREGGEQEGALAHRPAAATEVAARATSSVANDPAAPGAARFEARTMSPAAREAFARGLSALHAFWYEEAGRQFGSAIAADRTFAMAHWGLAMSKSKLLWGEDDVAGARAALRGLPPSSALPARERLWVRAAVALFDDGDAQKRREAFAAAMEQVYATYPDDESATFLALALLSVFRPEDPNGMPVRKRAGDLAMAVFRRNPTHPGAAHYLIHAYDTPELARLALPAARAYAASAPEAFHARHMPAHIFARLGMWRDAVASCRSAWDASLAWVEREHLPAQRRDWHSLDWIIEMSFERGRREEADAAMKLFADAVRGGLDRATRSNYARQVASYMARTGEWNRVDELLAPLEAAATDEAARAVAGASVTASCGGHAPAGGGPPFELLERRAALSARLRSAAMRRDPVGTRRLLAAQQALDAELRPFFLAAMGAEQLDAEEKGNALSDAAMLARARGDDRALLAALGPIAERAKHDFAAEGTAGGILPQEEIGDVLLRLGRPGEALAAYELVLARHAGRARALLGAARAAAAAGRVEASRGWYEKLLEVWPDADEKTPGLAEARRAARPPHP